MKFCTLALLTLSLYTHAGTMATLNLKGTVAPILDISLTPETNALLLPLEQSQSNLKIGTVFERSNYSGGYKVQISSVNQGNLRNGTNSLTYSLTYNGNGVNLVSGQIFTHSFTNAAVKEREVRISYTADQNLAAGDYTDNVTFTISAN